MFLIPCFLKFIFPDSGATIENSFRGLRKFVSQKQLVTAKQAK